MQRPKFHSISEKILLFLVVTLYPSPASPTPECLVDFKKFSTKSGSLGVPILFDRITLEAYEVVKVDKEAVLFVVPEGTSIVVFCGNSTISTEESSTTSTSTTPTSTTSTSTTSTSTKSAEPLNQFVAKCENASTNTFSGLGKKFKLEEISCKNRDDMIPRVMSLGGQKPPKPNCGRDFRGHLLKSATALRKDLEIRALEVCWSYSNRLPIYIRFETNFTLARLVIGKTDPNYLLKGGSVYPETYDFFRLDTANKPLSIIFRMTSIRRIINVQVGLDDKSDKYIFQSKDRSQYRKILRQTFLQDSYFFWPSVQLAGRRNYTWWPIWDVLAADKNRSNWRAVQNDIRSLIGNYIIYVGTLGTCTLPSRSTGDPVNLHIYENNNDVAFPVPRLVFWVVFDKTTKYAMVFIIVNNPYSVTDEDKICLDVTEEVNPLLKLSWHRDRVDLGYGYICYFADFVQEVQMFEDFYTTTVAPTTKDTAPFTTKRLFYFDNRKNTQRPQKHMPFEREQFRHFFNESVIDEKKMVLDEEDADIDDKNLEIPRGKAVQGVRFAVMGLAVCFLAVFLYNNI